MASDIYRVLWVLAANALCDNEAAHKRASLRRGFA